VASTAGTILSTECAVWLAELERAVAVEGFRVISWDVLLRAERTGGGSIYDVAKRLGADLVFILNSLEGTSMRGGSNLVASIQYSKATPRGERQGEFLLDDQQRRVLNEFMQEKIRLKDQQASLLTISVVLDTTAILASTGESVWYYRWGATRTVGLQRGTSFLFRGRDMFWRPVLPEGLEAPRTMTGTGILSSQQIMVSHTPAQAQDLYQQSLFALVQSVARDFVLNFRAGGGS
jgi:hypothetical protein